jgi:hypothetical protein
LSDTNQTTLPFKIFKLTAEDQFNDYLETYLKGRGIPERVQTYLSTATMDSCDAIRWALTEGNTTKTGRQPGGLGHKLIKDFIQVNEGALQIVSRFGYYEFSTGGEVYQKLNHDFPGTCINIEINTNGMIRNYSRE